jgi:hypothetical protein
MMSKAKQIGLAVCLVVLLPAALSARTWYVTPDSTGLATQIKAALDSASYGDTVLVAPGTYLETDDPNTWISLGPGISLVGEYGPEETVIELCNSTVGIGLSNCEGARVSGFTVRFAVRPGCGYPGGLTHGIRCNYCTDVVVENCIVEDVAYGIYVWRESQSWWKPLFRDITVRNCHWGIWCEDVGGPGRPSFENITITYCRGGVEVLDSQPDFESCSITHCGFAMEYIGFCGGNCDRCVIAHNEEGVHIHSDPPLAAPYFNGSWLPENANDFYDNAGWDIYYVHTHQQALVMAIWNYWGEDCPDFSSRIYGRVDYTPWTDSTHTRLLNPEVCAQGREPSTWGTIKALFR